MSAAARERDEWFIYSEKDSLIFGPFTSIPKIPAGCRLLGPCKPKKAGVRRVSVHSDRFGVGSKSGTPITTENIEGMFKSLERPKKSIGIGTLDFLTSIQDQFNRRGMLTPAQFDRLEQIYTEHTE